jgi:hypothetical protein
MKKNIISFICSLHGYLIRIKEIHWNTDNNSEHLLCDEISDDLSDCEDRFTECAMGMSGEHFKIGDLKPMLPNNTDLKKMLQEFEGETIDFKKSMDEYKEAGLVNICDDILECINKFKYRTTQR